MKYGYARVSTDDQKADLQIAALKKAGCRHIFTDTISGTVKKRPELTRCLESLRAGDVLIVWKLDRLGRSLSHLVYSARSQMRKIGKQVAIINQGLKVFLKSAIVTARSIAVLSDLQVRGVAFLSLTEAIDTESAAGRLMGHILGALAEFERALIVERTQAGLKAAKKRGTKLGRKPSLSDDQRKHAHALLDKGESPATVAKLLNVCRATLWLFLPIPSKR